MVNTRKYKLHRWIRDKWYKRWKYFTGFSFVFNLSSSIDDGDFMSRLIRVWFHWSNESLLNDTKRTKRQIKEKTSYSIDIVSMSISKNFNEKKTSSSNDWSIEISIFFNRHLSLIRSNIEVGRKNWSNPSFGLRCVSTIWMKMINDF